MRRALIDECLPVQLHRWLIGCEPRTVTFMGWKGKSDIELLAAATGMLDVVLTGVQSFGKGLDLAGLGLAVVAVPDTRKRAVEQRIPAIVEAVRNARSGERIVVP